MVLDHLAAHLVPVAQDHQEDHGSQVNLESQHQEARFLHDDLFGLRGLGIPSHQDYQLHLHQGVLYDLVNLGDHLFPPFLEVQGLL